MCLLADDIRPLHGLLVKHKLASYTSGGGTELEFDAILAYKASLTPDLDDDESVERADLQETVCQPQTIRHDNTKEVAQIPTEMEVRPLPVSDMPVACVVENLTPVEEKGPLSVTFYQDRAHVYLEVVFFVKFHLQPEQCYVLIDGRGVECHCLEVGLRENGCGEEEGLLFLYKCPRLTLGGMVDPQESTITYLSSGFRLMLTKVVSASWRRVFVDVTSGT